MGGYAALEMAFMRSGRVPERLKLLAELKAAALCGCEWCMDYGSSLSAEAGVSEQQLRELPGFEESPAFNEEEKLVLEYAECISQTPVDVPAHLFERLRESFDEGQLVELTYAAAIENMRARFNWALGIESQGYAQGAACVKPEPVVKDAPTKSKADG
jgi:AhpD family alkylhydroperoxidase